MEASPELYARMIRALDKAGSYALLAERLGVGRSTVGRWFSGTSPTRPSASARAALRAYVGEPPAPDLASEVVAPAIEAAGGQRALGREIGVTGAAVRSWLHGESIPTDAHVDAMRAFLAFAALSPLEQLKRWVRAEDHPAWLLRAAKKAKGRGSLRAWLGKRREGEGYVVDDRRAAERVWKTLQLEPPPGARDLLLELGAKLQAATGWEPPRRKGKRERTQEDAENPNTRLIRLRRERLAREAGCDYCRAAALENATVETGCSCARSGGAA